ncbi:MAG: hypothetical protein H6Q20_2366 [Bacteroidetes bacterium]|nr:hypothetical protein [Bacteroidota bacterium]
MIEAFIISSILLIAGVLVLGFRIFFIKGGEFPNIHIGGNQALKSKGVHCATTQDREAQQKTKPYTNSSIMNEITKKL